MKSYVRDLEEALIRTLAAFDLEGTRYEGLTGVWMPPAGGQGPRKIASIGVHVSRWVTTHGYALNVDLDPAPFTEWITACGSRTRSSRRWRRSSSGPSRSTTCDPRRSRRSQSVFDLALEEIPADDGAGLWTQSIHASLAAR